MCVESSDDEDDEVVEKKPAPKPKKSKSNTIHYVTTKPVPETNEIKSKSIHNVEYEDKLIRFGKDEMLTFLDHFDNCFNTVLITLAPLYHSPYSRDFLIECIQEWYDKAEHDKPEQATSIINRYYNYDESNKWFFSLLKHLDESDRQSYLNTYGNQKIDFSININNSNITYETIKRRRYNLDNIVKLFNDLRGCVGVIDDVWYLKVRKDNQTHIKFMSDDKLMKKLKTTKPFTGNNIITLYSIVNKFSNFFRYDSAEMSKDNKEDVINLFQGFKYAEIETDDFTILQPFLNHIKNVICAGDDEKYDYLMKWFANIFQNITVKNGTLPIIHGAQGSGKSFAVEVFGELMGHYALVNVDDLDKVFGKFNGLIGQHIFININEPPEANEKFKFGGKIKSKLTQKKHIQETKGIDQIETDSWANYSMTTNNASPVQEEKGNRRFIYFATNNSKCGDKKYFDELCKPIQPNKQGDYNSEFMGVLLHYMRTQIDVSDFDAETLIRQINTRVEIDYNEQLERQYADLNAVDKYVVDHYKIFVDGMTSEDIENIHIEGYKTAGIQKKLNNICDVVRKRMNGKRLMVYTLKPREQMKDLWDIIDYRNYGCDEDDNSIKAVDIPMDLNIKPL